MPPKVIAAIWKRHPGYAGAKVRAAHDPGTGSGRGEGKEINN